jgi:hypothetical protein
MNSASTAPYKIDQAVAALRPFGLRAGDKVVHPELKEGIVCGEFRHRPYFTWSDAQCVSTTADASPFAIHAAIEVVAPCGREIRNATVRNQRVAIEISPCEVLARYDLRPGDIVRTSTSIGVVIGEFTIFAIVESFLTGTAETFLPPGLELIGRPGESHIVPKLSASGSVVSVDIGFRDGDDLVPGDLIVAPWGLASIVGRSDGGHWVQPAELVRLNLGVVEMPSGEPVRVLRRLCPDIARFGAFLLGDIVGCGGEPYVVIDFEGKVCLESLRTTRVTEWVEPELLLRFGLPAAGEYEANSESYRGLRVFPGDVIEVQPGRPIEVRGMRNGQIWGFEPHTRSESILLETPTLCDHGQLNFVSKIDQIARLQSSQ